MATIQLNVQGMTCNGCVKSVTNVLQGIPGVTSVEVSLEQGRATISYDPAQTGPASFKQAIEDAGYEAG